MAELERTAGTEALVEIAPGRYDVSACRMKHNDSTGLTGESVSHIAIDRQTLRGTGTSPHDVVIYGDKSARVVYCWCGLVENVTISNGHAAAESKYHGGGGLCGRNAVTKAKAVVVRDCSSATSGGGISGVTCTGVTVEGCTAGTSGGGVYSQWNNPIFAGGVVRGCTAKDGAGACQVTVTNSLVHGNVASGNGGGCASARLFDSVVSNNVAGANGGGVADCPVVRGCEIVFNLASNVLDATSFGGGAYNSAVSGSVIAGNAVAEHPDAGKDGAGGGGYKGSFEDCEIFNNFAPRGAVGESASFVRCGISNNVASAKFKKHTIRIAQGLRDCDLFGVLIDTPGAMVNCTVRGTGRAWTLAPGENVYTNGSFDPDNSYLVFSTQGNALPCFTNCLFAGNALTSGLIFSPVGADKAVPIVNCTFADNTTGNTLVGFEAGSGLRCEVVNGIFIGNRNADGQPCDFRCARGTNVSLENCLVGTASAANVSEVEHERVILSNAANFDSGNAAHPYSLKRTSRARRKGKVMDWMTTATDIRRDASFPRLRDGEVDIGCYQCWLDPVGATLVLR